MPPKRNNSPPPPVMTWRGAAPALVVSVLTDALKLFFNMFWFFGPALAAIYCTAKVGSVVGTTAGGLLCGAGAGVVGFFGAGPIAAFGVIMADATAVAGFLALLLVILISNTRIFKTVATGWMYLGAGFTVGAMPLVGALPTFTFTTWRLYRLQMKIEQAAHKKWERENAAAQQQERKRQTARLMQAAAAESAPAEVY